MNELALFAGAGGGILGGQLLGWRTVCAVEKEPYPASVLMQRQNDGLLEAFPIWDDVCTFEGRPWRGIVDVVSGGFPCQDISAAGKGAGIDGERSGLWGEFARIIGEVRPRFAFIENSPMLTVRGLDRVLCDLARMGFDARWGVVSAADVGAPHLRKRIWIVAYANSQDESVSAEHAEWVGNPDHNGRFAAEEREGVRARSNGCKAGAQQTGKPARSGEQYAQLANTESKRVQGFGACGQQKSQTYGGSRLFMCGSKKQRFAEWTAEPSVGRVANGVAARVDRLKAIGNGQVPQCAAEAWRLLTKDLRVN